MKAVIIILFTAVVIAACVARHRHKIKMEEHSIAEELNNFLQIVYTTHDINDMEWIYTLKAAILNNAMKTMDTTSMAKKMDEAINNQLVIISDEMVRSGRMN